MGKDISAPKPVRAFFNSFAQVVFIENVISGIIILLAFFVAGIQEQAVKLAGGTGMGFEYFGQAMGNFDAWKYGIFAIVGAIVGNTTAKVIGNDEDAIASGLFGFCPVLVALGAAVFTKDMQSAWIVCILGSILVIPVTTIINKMCARFGLPGFTMPFIAITWFFILISFQTGLINYARAGALVNGVDVKAVGGEVTDMAGLLTKGWAEIYILDSVIASVMILVAFFVFKWDFGVKAIIAVAFSIALGYLLQVNMNSLQMGLYSYNAILVMGAMETFSTSKDNPTRYWMLVLLGLTLGVLIDYALPSIVGTFGCPSLTFPFVAAGWLTLYFEKEFFGGKQA